LLSLGVLEEEAPSPAFVVVGLGRPIVGPEAVQYEAAFWKTSLFDVEGDDQRDEGNQQE
jgi:hypothetical protein